MNEMEIGMRTPTVIVAATLLLAAGSTEIANFDTAEAGKPPSGWTATQTGTGHAKWAVVADPSAPSKPNVLKQSGQATFPMCRFITRSTAAALRRSGQA
jgi:hypothetical protein